MSVEEQVLGLEVAVSDLARMQVTEGARHHCRVQQCLVCIEPTVLAEQCEKLAPKRNLEEHVHLARCHEDRLEAQDERVVAAREDTLLVDHVLHLPELEQQPFVHALEGKWPASRRWRRVLHEAHPSEGTLSEHRERMQLVELDRRARPPLGLSLALLDSARE